MNNGVKKLDLVNTLGLSKELAFCVLFNNMNADDRVESLELIQQLLIKNASEIFNFDQMSIELIVEYEKIKDGAKSDVLDKIICADILNSVARYLYDPVEYAETLANVLKKHITPSSNCEKQNIN